MDNPYSRVAVAVILLVMLIQPSIAQSPIQEPPSNLMLIGGSTIIASTPPVTPKFAVLGALIGQDYEWDWDIANAVLKAESGGNPNAYNPEWHKGCQGSFGLWQIACVHIGKYGLTRENIFDPEVNTEVAYKLWQEYGWEIWGAYSSMRK
jgi:hypothetical protein